MWTNIKGKILLRRIYRNKKLQFCYQLCRRQKQGRPGTWYVEGITKMLSTELKHHENKNEHLGCKTRQKQTVDHTKKNYLNTIKITIFMRVF